jgi:ferredoxin-nitrite reductase
MATEIEDYKAGLSFKSIWEKILRYGREGWEQIDANDIHALKWYGVFLRKPTPGYFMIRVRVPGGILEQGRFRAEQLRALAEVTRDYGRDLLDLTTRQQVQLRWIRIEDVPEVLNRLERAGLTSLQTGHDNIRNVTTCPAAGLNPDEPLDSRALVMELHRSIVGNWNAANLPRKLNITVLGCRDNCTHAEINDIALTPAQRGGVYGYNVWVGGALGSWGTQRSLPLDLFVRPEQAVQLCHGIITVFNRYGNREKRNKARLKFVIDEMGLPAFRQKVLQELSFKPALAGTELTHPHSSKDHIGVHPQKQSGFCYAGLNVIAGRLKLDQVFGLARLAETYGNGEVRLTTAQNVIIPNIPEERLSAFRAEPLLAELPADPLPFTRGLIACTGNTFCPFALIETKERTKELAAYLDAEIGAEAMREIGSLEIHASGCPNSCGNPHTGHIGLIGKKVKREGRIVEAADIYLGAEHGLAGSFNERWKTGVPFTEMGPLLAGVIRDFIREKERAESFRAWCIRTGKIQGDLHDFAPMLKEG